MRKKKQLVHNSNLNIITLTTSIGFDAIAPAKPATTLALKIKQNKIILMSSSQIFEFIFDYVA